MDKLKKTTEKEFKEYDAMFIALGKKHKMPKAFVKDSCRCWRQAVKKVEAEEWKDFNFRNLK